jgi:CRISPR/Cas system CSM-associated protein Csm2 small subunit
MNQFLISKTKFFKNGKTKQKMLVLKKKFAKIFSANKKQRKGKKIENLKKKRRADKIGKVKLRRKLGIFGLKILFHSRLIQSDLGQRK